MSSKSAIYTSGPLPMNRQTSQQFASFGATGAPASVGNLRLSMVYTTFRAARAIKLALFSNYIASVITKSTANSNMLQLPPTKIPFDLAGRPELIITMPPKSSEASLSALEAAGFSSRTNGRFRYYSGPSTDAALDAALKAGASTDAFSPGNCVSVNGLVLYTIMSRVLFHAFIVFDQMITPTKIHQKDDDPSYFAPYTTLVSEDSFKITRSNLDTVLPTKGFFFPYFDGLLLPDNGHSLGFFCMKFSSLLGTKPNAVAEAMKTFGSGWSTLSNTSAGKCYSHILFCMEIAFMSHCFIRPVYLANTYAGSVFYTGDNIVTVGSRIHVPCDMAALKEQILVLESHDVTLRAICDLLEDLPRENEQEPLKIDPALLTHPRMLHDLFRKLTIGPDTQTKIAPLLRKLQFEQKLWDVTNPKHVQSAVRLISSKTFPDESVPFNIRLDAIYSKQPIFSVLAAFGNKAPSLRGSGSQIVRRIGPKFYESIDKPGRLVGIPIFAKSHQEAKEDWERIHAEATVFFDTKGKDKEGKLRVKNVTAMIPFDTDEARGIMVSLNLVTKKRKAEDTEKEGTEVVATQAEIDQRANAKKRKQMGFGLLGITAGLSQTAGVGMDVDDEDIFA